MILNSYNKVLLLTKHSKYVRSEELYLRRFTLYIVIGCADPDPPVGGWVKRHGESVAFGCDDLPMRVWQWICIRNRWSGINNNCTEGV